MLGEPSTLTQLIESSLAESESRARALPGETTRRITELENQRRRVNDAYVVGAFGISELQKRQASIDGELSVLRGLVERGIDTITVTPELVSDVGDVFATWSDLDRGEKRELLREFRIRMWVSRPARRQLKIDKIQIGVFPSGVCIFN